MTSVGPLDRLDSAVRAVSTDRKAMLHAVGVVEAAATALDATDLVCTTGQGSPARSSHRKAVPLETRAESQLRVLVGIVGAYEQALRALGMASVAVDGAARSALLRVVTSGQAEATAVRAFGARATGLWPQYVALNKNEALWITRAVTPWYRNDQEGKAAYQVLMEDLRPALDVARTQLGNAVNRVQQVVEGQTAVLAAADGALAAVRGRNKK